MLVMPALRPRVRKENEDLRRTGIRRKTIERFQCFRPDKFEIFGLEPPPLFVGAFDTFSKQIDAQAKPVWKGRRIPNQKMSVPTADFEGEFPSSQSNG